MKNEKYQKKEHEDYNLLGLLLKGGNRYQQQVVKYIHSCLKVFKNNKPQSDQRGEVFPKQMVRY